MKNIRGKHNKSLRLGFLLLSALIIFSASAIVYGSIIYEKALDVGATGGIGTGSGSASSAEAIFTPASMMMLAVVGLVIGLSIFGFLRESSKHISNALRGQGSSLNGHVSEPQPSMQGEERGEAPAEGEGEEQMMREHQRPPRS